MLGFEGYLRAYEVHGDTPVRRLRRTRDPASAVDWGKLWAKAQRRLHLPANWEVVEAEPGSLISAPSEFLDEEGVVQEMDLGQPDPSDAEEIAACIERVRRMLGELATQVPYGPIPKWQTGFEYVDWQATEDGDEPLALESRWWGSALKSDPRIVLEEFSSTLRNVLEEGRLAADMAKYRRPGIGEVSWIEITAWTVRFNCGACTPGARVDSDEVRDLLPNAKPKPPPPPPKPKRRRAPPAKRKARKAKKAARKVQRKAKKGKQSKGRRRR
jgi:hypothetical protein